MEVSDFKMIRVYSENFCAKLSHTDFGLWYNARRDFCEGTDDGREDDARAR